MDDRPGGTLEPGAHGATPGPRGAGRSAMATAGTALALAFAAGTAVALHLDGVAPERRWGAISFPLVWAVPGLLGLLARRRPALLLPAAGSGAVLSVLSLSGVTLLLLVPAGLHLAASRRRQTGPVPTARRAVLLVLPVGALAAFWVLLLHEDPRCWEVVRAPDGTETERTLPDAACATTSASSGTATASATGPVVGGGSTSDVVVADEATASALLVAATLTAGWAVARPPRSARP